MSTAAVLAGVIGLFNAGVSPEVIIGSDSGHAAKFSGERGAFSISADDIEFIQDVTMCIKS